jgi:hypothetical protein
VRRGEHRARRRGLRHRRRRLVLATLDRITDGDPQSWFDAWTAMAADLDARGEDALGRGHRQTASWAFLAAAEYYSKALVFVDGLADQSVLLPTFRRGRARWEKVIDASAGRFVRVQVPYEDTTLPGYLLRPDDSGAARPTLVVTNGSDGSLPGLLGYGGAEALARGWNAFVFDGRRPCCTCWTPGRRTRSTPPWPRQAPTRRRPGRWRSGASRTARPTRSTCSPRYASTRSGTWPGRSPPRC